MPDVVCLMMQRDEDDLLEPWIKYHASLFGYDRLFIWDNGSSSERSLSILSEYGSRGVNIEYSNNTPVDFRRKGVILGNKIKELEILRRHEFFIPLDCDEFLVVQTSRQNILCDSASIHQEFSALSGENRALAVKSAYYNILGQKSYYWCWPHHKTFFRAGTFGQMDHGYHDGKSKTADGRFDTRFVYMHYHHKPHGTIVEHSKNKMRPFFDVDVEDRSALQKIYDKNRLARFIVDDEDTYMKKFASKDGIYLPVFEEYLQRIGCPIPFDTAAAPTS